MKKDNLIFLDTETTGTDMEARLCQVAYKFQGKEVEELFLPPVPITIDSMAISHITNKMVAGKKPFINSSMYEDLKKILDDPKNILVAHNVSFDAEMLKREGLKIGQTIDTLKVASYWDKEGKANKYSLQYLRYFFDLEVGEVTAHQALSDVLVLEKLFDYLFEKMKNELGDDDSVIEKMLEISRWPILLKKFSFGKYTGQNIKEVVAVDEQYVSWLLQQKKETRSRGEGNEHDENWIYTLDYYLHGGE